MEILLQEEHLRNVTFMTLSQTQRLWPMLKNHLHCNMILVLETLILESTLNISEHALLMTSSLAIVF